LVRKTHEISLNWSGQFYEFSFVHILPPKDRFGGQKLKQGGKGFIFLEKKVMHFRRPFWQNVTPGAFIRIHTVYHVIATFIVIGI